MSDVRVDPLTDAMVIIDPRRAVVPVPAKPQPDVCPFCPEGPARHGQVLARSAGAWVVVNQHPVLAVESDTRMHIGGVGRGDAPGADELIVGEDHHRVSLDGWRMLRNRSNALLGDARLRQHLVAMDYRQGVHPVWRLTATAVEAPRALRLWEHSTAALFAPRVDRARREHRVVAESGEVVVWASEVPTTPGESWLWAPWTLGRADDAQLDSVHRVWSIWTQCLAGVFPRADHRLSAVVWGRAAEPRGLLLRLLPTAVTAPEWVAPLGCFAHDTDPALFAGLMKQSAATLGC